MKLIVQPNCGIAPVLSQIRNAKLSVDTTVFRLDLAEVEEELGAAVERGVAVRALVAHTNKGGEVLLRRLERRFREHGIAATRSASDLRRYHGKMLIIDRSLLNLMLFNYTSADTTASRSFALVTRDRRFVEAALRLFEADLAHRPYTPSLDTFVVSPNNARPALSTFIESARKQVLIYDPGIDDPEMIALLRDRARAGVEVRIIGGIEERVSELRVRALDHVRLHARVIVCDGRRAFLGSQSLALTELDARREIGMIVDDPAVVGTLKAVFASDWSASGRRARYRESWHDSNDRFDRRVEVGWPS